MGKTRTGVSLHVASILTSDAILARLEVHPPSQVFSFRGFGDINFPAESQIYSQLRSYSPGILTVEKESRLRFSRACRDADVTTEVAGCTQQEASEPDSANRPRTFRDVVGEAHISGPVIIARHTQVVRPPQVSPKLDLVVALNLCTVMPERELIFLLRQRAVTTPPRRTPEGVAKRKHRAATGAAAWEKTSEVRHTRCECLIGEI